MLKKMPNATDKIVKWAC